MDPSRLLKPLLLLCALAAGALLYTAKAGQSDPNAAQAAPDQAAPLPAFWVRPGFKVTLAAEDFGEARFMELDDKGNLYVSQPGAGKIVALKPGADGRYVPENTFVENRPSVHGLQWVNGWLWFTQSQGIAKARDTDGDGKADEVVDVIPVGQLPGGSGHWWRSILVTNDAIYTSVGDTGNIDEPKDDRQKIWKFDLNGKKKQLFISGIRNTEKLQLRPGTSEVWGCDQGSDNFGYPLGERKGNQPITDYNPPEELNHYVEGAFYGHPYVEGNRLPRIEYQNRPDILDLAAKTTPPAYAFGAHWAADGFTFISGKGMPAGWAGDMFIAFHGSWNRTQKAGYRVERVVWDQVTGQPCGSQMIVGTLAKDGQTNLARPVDCVQTADGSVLFSDDQFRKIYRISYTGPK